MPGIHALKRKRKRLIRQIEDHLDFLIGSVSSKGLKYEAYSLTTKVDGVTRTRHVPIGMVPLVRRLTNRHKKLKELIRELGDTNWLLIQAGADLEDDGTV